MPTNLRRLQRGSRRQLTMYCAYELLTGKIIYPQQGYDGYGDGGSTDLSNYISGTMKADWQANREFLLEVWQSGQVYPTEFSPRWRPWLSVNHDDSLPWAERQFGRS